MPTFWQSVAINIAFRIFKRGNSNLTCIARDTLPKANNRDKHNQLPITFLKFPVYDLTNTIIITMIGSFNN
ncbi:predicted protein [Arabidopsis lyrata subsp. lyrata]|uniref:Predicted protein n=1 Tax=Arabidopsis lyrata subsp. lyrata TaxID=81972 RepID=D7KDN7_ARALL|nr:predicted protein [Arabidopsis lyrata subsp. lyrata]